MAHNFQVNLGGMISILSDHLYSSSDVFLREIIQNAVDALEARKMIETHFEPQIHVEYYEGTQDSPAQLLIEDNGVGLLEQEVFDFLSTIGSSSKRGELFTTREEFIGQFGIGLLSCFLVTDTITLISRSIKDPSKAIKWIGKADGSFEFEAIEPAFEVGTKVYLSLSESHYTYPPEKIQQLLYHYANLLKPSLYFVHKEQKIKINTTELPWEQDFTNPLEEHLAYMEFGQHEFQERFFDAIPLKDKFNKTFGIAYVLNKSTGTKLAHQHKIYLKRMLIKENAEQVLPEWAYFVKCIINSTTLRPVASREDFFKDEFLLQTQDDIAKSLKNYLNHLAHYEVQKMRQLLQIHLETMQSMAIHDDEFLKLIINHIPFDTTHGTLTLPELKKIGLEILHLPNVDEFEKISPIAAAKGIPVISSGYTHKEQLLDRYASLFPNEPVQKIGTDDFVNAFFSLSEAEEQQLEYLKEQATEILAPYSCMAQIKKYKPSTLPALYMRNDAMQIVKNAEENQPLQNAIWQKITGDVVNNFKAHAKAEIYFNFNNDTIQLLNTIKDPKVLKTYIELFYCQALLMGRYHLSVEELQAFNTNFQTLLNQSLT